MATRRKTGSKKGRYRGLWLVLTGIAVGVAVVYAWQLIHKSLDRRGGLGNLIEISRRSDPPKPGAGTPASKTDKTARPKARYEFYTLLENEKVLPDRRTREDTPRPVPRTPASYVLQAGSFASFEDADHLKARLALSGFVAHIQKVEIRGKTWHRVRLGPYPRIDQLDAASDRLKKLGIRTLRLEVRTAG